MVIWSSTITAPQWPGGPQLPDKGLFQYPANTDVGGGGACYPVLKTQGVLWAADTAQQHSDHR